jgi:lipopolysaccharide transport system permease protein
LELPVKIYSPENNYDIKQVLLGGLRGYKDGFYLARRIFVREFRASYRTTYLGFLWALFPTISTALIWIFLRGTGVVSSAETNIPYPVFVLVGTMMWSLITESLSGAMNEFKANMSIVTKVNFSKEALIILTYFNVLYKMLFKLLMVIFLMFFFKVAPTLSIIWFVPMMLVTMVTLVSAGVILMPLEMMLPDFSKFKNAAFTLLMYITPVVYTRPASGTIATLLKWNPFTYMIEGLRNSLTGQAVLNPAFWLSLTLISVLLFLLSTIVYRIAAPIIIQRMSA